MAERWLPVVGYEGYYSVSDEGRTRSETRTILTHKGSTPYFRTYYGRIMSHRPDKDGYPTVGLMRDGKKHIRRVGHLVLEAFDRPRPPGMLMRHLNGTPPSDARLISIEWNTQSRNIFDVVDAGCHKNANKTECPSKHPYSDENTFINKKGGRICLECRRIYDRKRRPPGSQVGRSRKRVTT